MIDGIPAWLEWWREREGGRDWLGRLPAMIEQLSDQWSLELGPAMDSTFGYVCPVRRGGERAVLKISFPDDEADLEPVLLQLWGRDKAPAVLEHDAPRCAMLLERLEPGHTAAALDPSLSLDAALAVLPGLWVSPPRRHHFPLVHDVCARWASRYEELWEKWGRPFSRTLLDEAIEVATDLACPRDDTVMLHQDLHARNVLGHGTGWKVIDPKPLVGDRGIDVARIVRDRSDEWPADTTRERTLARRIEHAADRTGVSAEAIRRCGVMHTLAWSISDAGISRDAMEIAEWFHRCR